jgi:hypothetical protein
MARVMHDGDVYEDVFHVTNGVQQGCVLAPTLFSMVFAAMLTEAIQDFNNQGINISYRTDGSVLNSRRLPAITKTREANISNLLFADDCALTAMSECDMQSGMDTFSSACDMFGLTINTKKTEIMFHSAVIYITQHITTQESKSKAVSYCQLIVLLI